MSGRTIAIVVVVLAVVVGVVLYLRKRASASGASGRSPAEAAANDSLLTKLFPPAAPPKPPQIQPTGGSALKSGLGLAAAAGCTAYTGGAGAAACGLAAPIVTSLAVDGGRKLASGTVSVIKKLNPFSW